MKDSVAIRTRTASRSRTSAVVAIVSLLVLCGAFLPVVTASGPPPAPVSVHGEVQIGSEPAPEGTEIIAVVDGDERGSIVVSDDGSYGGPSITDNKLVVSGDEDDKSETITFLVDGELADQTIAWESGKHTTVNLTVNAAPADQGGGISGEPPSSGELGDESLDGNGTEDAVDRPNNGSEDSIIDDDESPQESPPDDNESLEGSTTDDDEQRSDSDEGVPGFTIVGTLVALAITIGLYSRVGSIW